MIHINEEELDSSEDTDEAIRQLLKKWEEDDKKVLNIIEEFLSNTSLPKLKGICALTCAIDYSSLTGTFIFDWDNKKFLRDYGGRFDSNSPKYIKIKNIEWTINLAVGLPNLSRTGKKCGGKEDPKFFPFCCERVQPQRNRYGKRAPRLSNEHLFTNFKDGCGSSPYTYRVVKKVQRGPLEKIGYYTLNNGKREEVNRNEREHRENSFKIYTCDHHNTYFAVNLFVDEQTHNKHHAKGQHETEYGPELLKAMCQ